MRLVTKVTLEEFRAWFQVEHVVLEETHRGLLGDVELTGDDAEAFAMEYGEIRLG